MRRRARVALPAAVFVAAGALVAVSYDPGPPTVPQEFRRLVVDAAATCPGLDARLLAAQLEAESGWDPSATSAVGAQGIAQFMPRVWASYAVDGDGDGVRDVWNPRDAILSAARFDCVLMREVAGIKGDRVRNMLAAYNAGPDQVRRYSGPPPFPETRAYVERIVGRAGVIQIGPTA